MCLYVYKNLSSTKHPVFPLKEQWKDCKVSFQGDCNALGDLSFNIMFMPIEEEAKKVVVKNHLTIHAVTKSPIHVPTAAIFIKLSFLMPMYSVTM